MLIVWDEAKRLANVIKHGLDFAAFEEAFGFDGAKAYATRSSRTGVERFLLVGRWNDGTIVVAILSPLGSEALSLVSLRVASRKERDAYDRA